MNAGCYGTETKDRLIWADVVDLGGQVQRLTAAELAMSYRHNIRADQIVVRARFRCEMGDPQAIKHRLRRCWRNGKLLNQSRGAQAAALSEIPKKFSAWKLIDEAGCRGARVGQAQVSEKHCNFLLNTDNCAAARSRDLGKTVRDRVKANSGYDLHWEIVRIGRLEYF